MLTIERFTPSRTQQVLKVTLAEEQTKFAATAEDFLTSEDDGIELHIIKLGDDVVGFFKIDVMFSLDSEFNIENGIGLRSFVIDVNQQGKGLGTSSVKALFPYLKKEYPSYRFVYLTVNCKNTGARACYLKGGFDDTGKQYLGGAAGPQHIMQGVIA
uniref:Spermine/spermidine acetyltransferase n=1 Tax=Aliivibrio wodanis TaxID=80852 RepID=A0A5Q4ZSK2_9GAMM|nr:Spermine/spermidine acetyltransferase [Aliivibrio wodanis]